jgi:hypothetical protein
MWYERFYSTRKKSLWPLKERTICSKIKEKYEEGTTGGKGCARRKDVCPRRRKVGRRESFATSFTKEQKEQIRQMVADMFIPAKIGEIEHSLQRGKFPDNLPTVTPSLEMNGNGANRKRPADKKEESSAKQSHVANS